MQYIIPAIVLFIAVVAFFNIPSKANAKQQPNTEQSKAVASQKQHAATASYLTPRRKKHEIGVTLSLKESTITNAEVSYNGGKPNTPQHKSFDSAYKGAVIGKNIQDVSLSRVGGASLTSDAFNQAVDDIRKKL